MDQVSNSLSTTAMMAITLTLMLTLTPASAQGSRSWTWCVNKEKESLDLQVLGCTAGIWSGEERKLVSAFLQRANASYAQKEYDRAIAEYEQVIRLDPNDIPASTSGRLGSTAKRDTVIAQDTLSPEKEDSPEERWKKQMQKEAEEDKWFAATCNPLKRRVMTILRSAGVETRAFNQAFVKLKEIQAQLVGSCPERIQIFGGFVEKIVNCYNGHRLLRLSDGRDFSFLSGSTYLFGQDQPWAIGEFVTGVTRGVYYCVSSIDPVIVYRSLEVTAAARRKWTDGDREKLLSDRASIRARKNEHLDARIAELDRKIAHNSNDAAALAALGTAYLEKGDYNHALEKINMAVVLEPGNAARMNERCWTRALANRELREGLNDCNKSLELRPNDPDTLDSRGYIYLRLGEYDKAIADFDAGLQNRKTWDTWASSAYGRGLAKRKNGDSAGGNEDIKKALEIRIDIDDQMAFFGLK